MSNERAEAAESLRDMAYSHIRYAEQFAEELFDAIVPESDWRDYDGLYDRLADLIDPTCEVVSENWMVNKTTGERHGGCSLSCGHIVMNDVPAYCPFCGARVVGDHE